MHPQILACALALSAASSPDVPQDGTPRPAQEGIERSSFRWAQSGDGGWVLVAAFDPMPGWHVYWENPGDSGNAPSFELTLPPGWQAGRVVYPRPDVRTLDGSVFYGYSRNAQYLIPVTRSDSLSSDPWDRGGAAPSGTWKVRAKVMACKERCVVATFSAQGEWPPQPEAGSGLRLDGGSFAGRALPSTAASAGVFARLEAGKVRIEGPAKGLGTARFIPSAVPGMQVDLPDGQVAVEGAVSGDRFVIEFRLQSPGTGPGEPAVAGLVLLGNGPGDPCVRLAIPHPLAGPEPGPMDAGSGASGSSSPPN